MSEFSESLHLRGEDPTAGVGLLRRAKVAGYVFPAADGWISIAYHQPRISLKSAADLVRSLVEARDRRELARMVDANEGTLLHYSYAEDHGCSVAVYEERRRVCRLAVSFDSKRRRPRFDRDAFLQRSLMTAAAADSVELWLAGKRPGRDDRYTVGNALGLPHFEWFSYGYEVRDDVDHPPGRLEVDATGKARLADSQDLDQDLDIEALIRTLPPTKKARARKASPAISPEYADALQALAEVTAVLASREGIKPKL
jgi:hypothetical protein